MLLAEEKSRIEQSWRWFGPTDPISLAHIRQAGATGVVTALHHIPNGEVWPIDEIMTRKNMIEQHGLTWVVVESVPVHEDIKQARGDAQKYLANYVQTVRNLASCGINLICYNFMPLLDWTRTDIAWRLPDGSEALRFDAIDAVIFDTFILERLDAQTSHSPELLAMAAERFAQMPLIERQQVTRTILSGLPGTVDDLSLDEFHVLLKQYENIDSAQLRENYAAFLRTVIPVAEETGVLLCIHPDDPPFPIFGLPRIASVADDFAAIIAAIDSPSNGITFCTGSLGANPNNDLVAMFRQFAHRVHFLHFRNVKRESDGSFFEADHLAGDVDMAAMMEAVIEELDRRDTLGIPVSLPLRPDHGHRMLGDLENTFYPGYSAVGRLRGLAELRGLEAGIRHVKKRMGD